MRGGAARTREPGGAAKRQVPSASCARRNATEPPREARGGRADSGRDGRRRRYGRPGDRERGAGRLADGLPRRARAEEDAQHPPAKHAARPGDGGGRGVRGQRRCVPAGLGCVPSASGPARALQPAGSAGCADQGLRDPPATRDGDRGQREPRCEGPATIGGVSARATAATLREVEGGLRRGIVIDTFRLDDRPTVREFRERMTRLDRGLAFCTRPCRLADAVLVDHVAGRRTRV